MPDTYQEIIGYLARAKRVLVTTHVRPDGDALGTSAAMVLALRKAGIHAEVLLLSHLPAKYAFVYTDNAIIYHDAEQGWPQTLRLDSFDCFLVVDTGTWSQLPGVKDKVRDWRVPKLVLDHHLTQEDWADAKLVVTQAAAAGEIAAELLRRWEIPLDKAIGSALFLAIASDTGWFQFANTRPLTMRLAADLMEAGVDTDQMYKLLFQNEKSQRVFLQIRAQESLELLLGSRLAVMRVRKRDFDDIAAGVGDTENVINIPLQIRSVEVSILLVEPKEGGPIRISLRSKGQLDVARFAEQFGGGGHARAAGLKIEAGIDDARDKVVAAMTTAMNGAAY